MSTHNIYFCREIGIFTWIYLVISAFEKGGKKITVFDLITVLSTWVFFFFQKYWENLW